MSRKGRASSRAKARATVCGVKERASFANGTKGLIDAAVNAWAKRKGIDLGNEYYARHRRHQKSLTTESDLA